MSTALTIKAEITSDGKSIKLTNLTGAISVPTSAKLNLTKSIAVITTNHTIPSQNVTALLTALNATTEILFSAIFTNTYPADDFYKISFTGYDVNGNPSIVSNISALFSSLIIEGTVNKNLLFSPALMERKDMTKNLAKALILIEGLRVLRENITIDKEISVTTRIRILQRNFQ
jgi:hypothetical protein